LAAFNIRHRIPGRPDAKNLPAGAKTLVNDDRFADVYGLDGPLKVFIVYCRFLEKHRLFLFLRIVGQWPTFETIRSCVFQHNEIMTKIV